MKIINSKKAPQAVGPYSQAVYTDNLIFVSGQIALDKEGNMQNANIETEAKQVMENLKAILEEVGLNFSNVIKSEIFLTNINDFAIVNEIYSQYFKPPFPARVTIGVNSLPKGANIEISIIVNIKNNE
jgi:2-iminobutanoate/2-iminopropanoate deaminase